MDSRKERSVPSSKTPWIAYAISCQYDSMGVQPEKNGYDLPAGSQISSNIDHSLSHLSAHILTSSVPTKNYVISASYVTHLLLKNPPF